MISHLQFPFSHQVAPLCLSAGQPLVFAILQKHAIHSIYSLWLFPGLGLQTNDPHPSVFTVLSVHNRWFCFWSQMEEVFIIPYHKA